MRRLLAALLVALALAPLPALAQSSNPPTLGSLGGVNTSLSNAVLPISRTNLGADAGAGVNLVTDYAGKCDEKIAYDGAITTGTAAFSSASGAFVASDVGKTFVLAGGGTTQSLGSLVAAAAGTGYVPTDTIVFTGGTGTANSNVLVATTKVVSATIAAAGSGGTPGTQTVTGTTGAGSSKFTASVTVSAGGAITAVLSISAAGSYTTNPTLLTAEPVTGGGLTGAQLNVVMGVNLLLGAGGVYTVVPTNPVSQGSSSGTGTGATFTATWMRNALKTTIAAVPSATTLTLAANSNATLTNARYVYGTDDTTAVTNALSSAPLSTNGGTLALPGMCLLTGAIAPPFTGTNPPKQPPLRITGIGSAFDSTLNDQNPLGGGGFDLLYDGTDTLHPAKIDTRGIGNLELDHLTIRDSGSDNFLMLQTTNTTLNIHDNHFSGNPSCSGSNCTQDILQFGGITGASSTLGGVLATNGFQGYGTQYVNNTFSHARRIANYGGSANAIFASNNSVDYTSGTAEQLGAPYKFLGVGLGTTANQIVGGIVELTNYVYFAAMTDNGNINHQNTLQGVFAGDSSVPLGDPTRAAIYYDTGDVDNILVPSYVDGNLTLTAGPGAGKNVALGNRASSASVFPSGIDIGGYSNKSWSHYYFGILNTNPAFPLDIGDGVAAWPGGIVGSRQNVPASTNWGMDFSHAGVLTARIGNYSYVNGGGFDDGLTLYSTTGYHINGLNSCAAVATGATGNLACSGTTGSGTTVVLATGGALTSPTVATSLVNSGYEAITGTTLPTPAAGTLGIGGEVAVPTFAANGEAALFSTSTTGGISLMGKGSTNDFTLYNAAGATTCILPTGGTSLSCPGVTVTSSTSPLNGIYLPASNTVGLRGATSLQFNANTTNVGDYNVTTASTWTLGAATTINNATFKVTTLGVSTAVDVVCYNSATGLFTEEPTGTTCTVSDERKKTAMQPLSLKHSLDTIMASNPISYYYKPEAKLDDTYHLGFGAQTMAKFAPELVQYGADGEPEAVKQIELLPVTWAAIKQMKAENDELRADLAKLRHDLGMSR